MSVLTERGMIAQALVPLERAMNTNTATINVRDHHEITFLLYKGAGAVGTADVTVEACDDQAASNQTAIDFKYRRAAAGDTWGDLTDVDAGNALRTTANANEMYEIVVDVDAVTAATVNNATGNTYVRLNITQVDATVVDHGVLAILTNPRYKGETQRTVLT